MKNNRIQRITNNLDKIGACWSITEGKCNGTYNIHSNAKCPYENKIIHFLNLSDLEKWIQLKKELLQLEEDKTTYTDRRKTDILEQLNMIEVGII